MKSNPKRILITLLVCAGSFNLAHLASKFVPDSVPLFYFFAGMAYMWYLKEIEV